MPMKLDTDAYASGTEQQSKQNAAARAKAADEIAQSRDASTQGALSGGGSLIGGIIGAIAAGVASGGMGAPAGFALGSSIGGAVGNLAGEATKTAKGSEVNAANVVGDVAKIGAGAAQVAGAVGASDMTNAAAKEALAQGGASIDAGKAQLAKTQEGITQLKNTEFGSSLSPKVTKFGLD